ncbi:MAG: helix-turn-helix domain-containing protein [Lachnospiraceae bacterium]|nr:helix-turn-helix domain-containing protein [Lachnospiraceae bacterium]
MAARLTDAQKKKVIADYVEVGSYAAVGRMNGVSDKTVKAIVKADPETSRISEQKKKQNTLDMLQYMDDRRKKAQKIMDTYLEALLDPKKIKNASLSQIATAFGIIIDKFVKNTNVTSDLNKLDEILANIQTLDEIVAHPAPDRNIEDYE